MNSINQTMVGMNNNLTECIEKSGLTNNEVAAAKGVTPETLRRHRNGKIQMTLRDAEHYARIIGVSVHNILFKSDPIPLIGGCLIKDDIVERHIHSSPTHHVFAPNQYLDDQCCMSWQTEKKYHGMWYEWDGALQFLKHSPIVDKFVSEECYQKICLAKTTKKLDDGFSETDLFSGMLYPQPGGLYTVHNGKSNGTIKDVELEWATPILGTVFRPELVGIMISKSDTASCVPCDNITNIK